MWWSHGFRSENDLQMVGFPHLQEGIIKGIGYFVTILNGTNWDIHL